jgi:hypothetical protein
MTTRLLDETRRLPPDIEVEVCFEGGSVERMAALYGGEFRYRPQEGGDLGTRMLRAFERAFSDGCRAAVLVGTDVPDLNRDLLAESFRLLGENEIVIGPASDGGYYLVGLRRVLSDLFDELPWGAPTVFRQTMDIAERLGVVPAVLEMLDDVDRPEDLVHWERARRLRRISIIIPTLNEEEHVGRAIESVSGGEDIEIIVADGGSRDRTCEIAHEQGALVVESPSGRAVQMNAGAARATGGLLFFLHADARPPVRFDAAIRRIMADKAVAAGAFSLRVDDDLAGIRLIERLAAWRSHRGMPYGDQGLFLRTDLFRKVGGFPEQPLMEDFELMRRLRRLGRIVIANERIIVSGRRWRRLGVLRVTLINQAVILGYLCGVSPERLAKWYRGPSLDENRTPG